MTLPEICPLGDNQTCKGRECHLFCLEWRMKEPICLIGYSTTSKLKSGKADRNKDSYAEDTFRKLSGHPVYNRKDVYEKGDWIPTKLAEKSMEKPAKRKDVSERGDWIPTKFAEKSMEKPAKRKDISERGDWIPTKFAEKSMEKPAKRKNVSERGDWIPTRLAEKSMEKPAGRIEEKFTPQNSQRTVVITPGPKNEKNNDFRPNEMYTAIGAGEASIKLEARMKKESYEGNQSICTKTQPVVLEKLNLPEKVVSTNKDTTIFISSDTFKKKENSPSNNEENTKEP
jgi:hypothetical protein